jgi:carotenoid cleavage dioxygenase-like enzyme
MYSIHVMNAWQAGTCLYADIIRFDASPLFPRADGRPIENVTSFRPCRWRFDLAGATKIFTQTCLRDVAGEFPRIDERFGGLAYRHGSFFGRRPAIAPHRPAGDGKQPFTTWQCFLLQCIQNTKMNA